MVCFDYRLLREIVMMQKERAKRKRARMLSVSELLLAVYNASFPLLITDYNYVNCRTSDRQPEHR